ncbi:replication initiation and membrane attachment family protein [Levilactobacillus humaensis]|uniref:replication initiation and membrane attachment family protein n=1 Tax=Levilactobacillus humaensis TaxID=2950375 RepID=UPI0021C3BD68|nr:DnaD domain protein [Levilactobacillus humaensis]
MEDSWHQLQPKTTFLVRVVDRVADQSWQSLTQLYQPIIGPSATGLFSALFWLPKRGTYQRHATLLAELGMDLSHLYDARLRLEATGLLTTRVKTEQGLQSFIYELHAPLSPAAFFNDDLLSVQLLGMLGDSLYQSLVAANTVAVDADPDEENISKNFLDVFHVNSRQIMNVPEAVSNARQALTPANESSETAAEPADFDFKLLGEILNRSYVDTQDLGRYRSLLITEITMYGLDEPTLARFIGEATDLASNQFNPQQFKRLIADQFGRQSAPQTVAATTPTATSTVSQSAGTSSQEAALIKVASTTAPALFLRAIKQKNGGFVTDGEQRVVRDLVSRQLFPESVLNLMIFHVLVDEDRPTLNKNLLDTIANDWSKAKVNTPQLAIHKIRERQAAAAKPRRSRKQPTVKETLPEWAKKPSEQVQTSSQAKLSPEQQEQLKARIARLEQRSKEGKED